MVTAVRLAPVTLLVLAACWGLSARQKALLPTMRMSWDAIAAEVADGISADVAAGRLDAAGAAGLKAASASMTAALAADDVNAVASQPWPALKLEAESGIAAALAAKKIGPDVVPSLKARLVTFGDALAKFTEKQ